MPKRTFLALVPLAILLALLAFSVTGGGSLGVATIAASGEEAEMQSTLAGRAAAQTRAAAAAPAEAGPITYVPAAEGWRSERMLADYNDWEPAVAADPSAPYVYILTTRYGADKGCETCRHQGIALHRSLDGGVTFEEDWIWVMDVGTWQADPQIVTDAAGNIYVGVLTSPWTVYFTKSTDHGLTWSAPVDIIDGRLGWVDHEWLAVSDDGQDIYFGYNKRLNYQTASHDGGATWGDPVLTSDPADPDYYFSVGGTVLPDDTVVFANAAYGCCPYNTYAHTEPIDVWAVRSVDLGATWEQVKIDTMAAPPECTSYKCPAAQYGTQPSIASDDNGKLLMVYSGGAKAGSPQRIWIVTSDDGGATWSRRMPISPRQVDVAFMPQVAGTGDGDFRVMWSDNRNGHNRFNIWSRSTTDGGKTWDTEAMLSNAGGGTIYKHITGFNYFYGDYGEMDITDTGRTIAVWSESINYWGPGNTWYAVQK